MNLKKKMAVGVFLSAIGLMFSSLAQADKKTLPAQQAPVASVAANDDTYVRAEDVLNVNVWKEAEVSGAVPVRPDGKISLPLLNDVQAAGSTPMQLTNQITEKLKKFLTDPHVTVTVTAVDRRRVLHHRRSGAAGGLPATAQHDSFAGSDQRRSDQARARRQRRSYMLRGRKTECRRRWPSTTRKW